MGVDRRIGKQDNYTRYRVYKDDVDIHTCLEMTDECLGILHAKDVTAYNSQRSIHGMSRAIDNDTATIETTDRIELSIGYILYCIPEEKFYRVESISRNSHNSSQRYSARPIITTQINIISFSD